MSSHPRPGPDHRPDLPAAAADALAVTVFVLLGRTSHREGGAVTGYLGALWPFLAGAAVGWAVLLVVAARGRAVLPRSPRAGAVVLAATVVAGMALRRAFTDGGTPVSFLLVATAFLALFLVGWRVAAARLARRAERSRP